MIARAGSAQAVDNFFANAKSRPGGTSAICIDTSDGEEQFNNPLNAIFRALAAREKLARLDPELRVFLGVCGLSGSPWSIKSLLAMGLDFVSAGSVLLATQEANVDPLVKEALTHATFEHFQPVPNWHYPEFGKSVWAYLPDEHTGETLMKLHRTYIEESDATKIEQVLTTIRAGGNGAAAYPPRGRGFKNQTFSLLEMRRKLRNAVCEWAKPRAVPSDTSIAQWNAWKSSTAVSVPEFPTAQHVMELLYPGDQHQ